MDLREEVDARTDSGDRAETEGRGDERARARQGPRVGPEDDGRTLIDPQRAGDGRVERGERAGGRLTEQRRARGVDRTGALGRGEDVDRTGGLGDGSGQRRERAGGGLTEQRRTRGVEGALAGGVGIQDERTQVLGDRTVTGGLAATDRIAAARGLGAALRGAADEAAEVDAAGRVAVLRGGDAGGARDGQGSGGRDRCRLAGGERHCVSSCGKGVPRRGGSWPTHPGRGLWDVRTALRERGSSVRAPP